MKNSSTLKTELPDALTEQEKKELIQSVGALGHRAVAALLKVSRLSLSSAIAGFPVTRGTILLIRTNKHLLGVIK